MMTYNSLPALSMPAPFIWISWEHSYLAVGRGNMVGENTLASYKAETVTNIDNITVTFNGSLTLSFGYYFGNRGKPDKARLKNS